MGVFRNEAPSGTVKDRCYYCGNRDLCQAESREAEKGKLCFHFIFDMFDFTEEECNIIQKKLVQGTLFKTEK